jgi:3-methyladenine DNA glycosylase/8-oxoguanine DNA glycosylase
MARPSRDDVAAGIVRADRAFAAIVALLGPPPRPRAEPVAQRFGTLAKAILYQQLAGAAAATIHGRVLATVGEPLTARAILSTSDDDLAACGVSAAKRRALVDLATKTADGSLDLGSLGRRTDDEVLAALTTVTGIGTWTAQMFCIVTLARPDVWPSGDYGVRLGWTVVHGGDLLSAKELATLGDPFRPERSAVAWYCWRAIESSRAAERAS